MERKETFDTAVAAYEAYRPPHPEALFEDLPRLTGFTPPARVLEIGCGPGQATLPLARRGYRVHAIELGANLAARCHQRLREEKLEDITIDVGTFETTKVAPRSAELVLCASAFHWLDRAASYPKIHEALVPGGSLVVFWTTHRREGNGSGLRAAVEKLQARWAPELTQQGDSGHRALLAGLPDELTEEAHFKEVEERTYRSELTLDARTYAAMLGTYSAYLMLDEATRRGLLADVEELVTREFGGRVELDIATRLFCART